MPSRARKAKTTPVVRLRHHARLTPPSTDAEPFRAAPGPSGELTVVWASPENNEALSPRTVQPGWASIPRPRPDAPVAVQVATYHPDLVTVVSIAEQAFAYPHVQPLPEGEVLLVGARCSWEDEATKPNAVIYDADGRPVREGVLGDGIAAVQATPTGDIWVSYFDEGVFGNLGWGGPGPAPIGSPGLIRCTADLDIAWRYPYDSFGAISDCYALNVTGNDAWAYYYTDFPIVRIRADEITGWANEVKGAHALVVTDDRVVLVGGYRKDRHRILAGNLEGDAFSPAAPARLVMPDGRPLPEEAALYGRGDELHVVLGHEWLKVHADDLTSPT
jgi:hypothetical protein